MAQVSTYSAKHSTARVSSRWTLAPGDVLPGTDQLQHTTKRQKNTVGDTARENLSGETPSPSCTFAAIRDGPRNTK